MDNNFSLLYPQGKKPNYKVLPDETCNDLSLDYLCENLTENDQERRIIRKMMTQIECDPEVIAYRRDVFDDILRYPMLRLRIHELLGELDFLKEMEKSVKDRSAAPVWQLINRLHELDVYVNCIAGINEAFTENEIHSDGLKALRDYVNSIYNESGFEYLHEDIKDMMTHVGSIRSLSIGVNLDEHMRPSEIGIVSLNDEPFVKPGLLGKFLDFASKKSEINHGNFFQGMTKIHTVARVAGDDPLLGGLSTVMEEMLGNTVKQLKSRLGRYVNVSGYSLTKLIPEFIFYIRWAEYLEKVRRHRIPICRPEIKETPDRRMSATGIYNFKLAIQVEQGKKIDIIRNNIEFTPEHGIYIMTGPNRGGKTTFTQAVGHVFLMAQHGLYAPAEYLEFSPADNIFTHFPADENQTVDLGRLGEESQRLSEIFSVATSKSLLLFNESLATTSFAEGLFIAKDVVRALRYLGARTIFNTHMHELASDTSQFNDMEGDLKVASLITGIHEGTRSYKVFLAPPEGVSYARDIAEKYGVTFGQLKQTIDDQDKHGEEDKKEEEQKQDK